MTELKKVFTLSSQFSVGNVITRQIIKEIQTARIMQATV